MTEWVIDNSVTMAWLLAEAVPEPVASLRKSVETSPALAPSVWRLEVGNGLLVAARRRRMTSDELDKRIAEARALRVIVDFGDANRGLFGVWDLARLHHLTTYDATYLELALRYSVGLASLDEPLNVAARQCGVRTLLKQ